jgi:hypothetical protein
VILARASMNERCRVTRHTKHLDGVIFTGRDAAVALLIAGAALMPSSLPRVCEDEGRCRRSGDRRPVGSMNGAVQPLPWRARIALGLRDQHLSLNPAGRQEFGMRSRPVVRRLASCR